MGRGDIEAESASGQQRPRERGERAAQKLASTPTQSRRPSSTIQLPASPVVRVRLTTLLRVSVSSAAALSFVGIIGFVGLVGPHIARLMVGEDHRHYLPASALAGALMLSLASTLSKVLIPGVVLPIGIITALVGVPMFMALVLGRRRRA